MRRILAEVVEASDLPPDLDDGRDLPWRKVRCLVKVLSNVPECYHLPAEVKDSTCTIEREALFPWEYEPGTKVVLTPEESKPISERLSNVPEVGKLRGRVVTYRTDVNGDGFTERVIENSFIRVVIGPRFGARIWEIWHKRRNCNPLYQTYDFNNDFAEIGGQTDHVCEQGGLGELWNAEFKEKEVVRNNDGCRVVYEFKSEKSKGLTVVKEISVAPDRPVVSFRVTFKYAGAEKPPEDGKPDEFELTYWTRTGLAIGGDPGLTNVILTPGKDKLRRQRPERTWHSPRCYNLAAPYLLARNEDTGLAVALLFDPDQVNYTMTYSGREFYTFEPRMKAVRIPKDGEQTFAQALVIADSSAAEQDGLALSMIGPTEDGETPVYALSTVGDADGKLNRGRVTVPMKMEETNYPGVAKVSQAASWIRNTGSGKPFTGLSLNGRKWNLACGGEK